MIRLWLHKFLHLIIEDQKVLDICYFIELEEREFLADQVRLPCLFELIEFLHFLGSCQMWCQLVQEHLVQVMSFTFHIDGSLGKRAPWAAQAEHRKVQWTNPRGSAVSPCLLIKMFLFIKNP